MSNHSSSWPDRLAFVLLVIGLALVVAGVARWSIAAATVTAGALLVVAAYVIRYYTARNTERGDTA